jgi:putative tryptophan/tyrosine transport system substrate-binding protein
MNIKKSIIIIAISLAIIAALLYVQPKNNLPIIAIANYGPHSSLEQSIIGIKEELESQGFIENQNISYEIADVSFDPALIPQMISKLKNKSPKVMIVMTTPVAQYAKGTIHNIPLIYNVITDPVASGLIKNETIADKNMTGSSDRQNIDLMLEFSQKLLANAKRVGVLYSTAESNDAALIAMLKQASKSFNMEIVAIPIDQARDIPIRMEKFKNNVDFIYVGTSGPIQPALPVIAATANKMHIPIINVDSKAVKEGLVLASYGVNYKKVGINTGKLTAQILNGTNIAKLAPIYPNTNDHSGFISKKNAQYLGITIPDNIANIEIIE